VSVPFAGITPASAYTETTHEDPLGPPIILADAIDPATGEFTSLERGLDPIDGAVLLTCSVKRSSGAAIIDVGHRFHEIRYVAPDVKVLAESAVRECVQHLTRAGLIELRKILTEVDGDSAATAFEYHNIPQRDDRATSVTA
jgi:hypothetical protein